MTILFSVATPIAAQSGMGDLVQIEVLDGGMTPRGTYQSALRLTLADGWKTYWRAPGDAGIPPAFSWKGSRNVGDVKITWPSPQVFEQSGFKTIGYTNQLILPVEIEPRRPDRPVRLRGEVEIGVCKDVCVPGTLSFDHQLDQSADRNSSIVAALAARPYSAAEAGVRSATCKVSAGDYGLRIEARITMPHAGGQEFAVIEPGNPKVWASETRTTRSGDVLVATSDLVHADAATYALDRSRIRITVLGKRISVDIQGCSAG